MIIYFDTYQFVKIIKNVYEQLYKSTMITIWLYIRWYTNDCQKLTILTNQMDAAENHSLFEFNFLTSQITKPINTKLRLAIRKSTRTNYKFQKMVKTCLIMVESRDFVHFWKKFLSSKYKVYFIAWWTYK